MPIRFRYQTIEFDSIESNSIDIHLRSLRDKQEFSDPFGEAESLGISSAQWSLFGVVWESSQTLAQKMANYDITNKRILEVGCGMGLSSLVLNKRRADITATDYHPEAGNFLQTNATLNDCPKIPFLRTSWADEEDGLGLFDVIIGADLLYEKEHVALLAHFIHNHANPTCEVLIVDPGRGFHSAFCKIMVSFGFTVCLLPDEFGAESKSYKGQITQFLRTQ